MPRMLWRLVDNDKIVFMASYKNNLQERRAGMSRTRRKVVRGLGKRTAPDLGDYVHVGCIIPVTAI